MTKNNCRYLIPVKPCIKILLRYEILLTWCTLLPSTIIQQMVSVSWLMLVNMAKMPHKVLTSYKKLGKSMSSFYNILRFQVREANPKTNEGDYYGLCRVKLWMKGIELISNITEWIWGLQSILIIIEIWNMCNMLVNLPHMEIVQ